MPKNSNDNNSLCKENIVKLILGIILPWAYLYVCFSGFYGILFLIPATVIVSILYAVPLFLNSAKVKSEEVKTIKPYIIRDALFSLLPAVSSCLFTSITLDVFFDGFEHIWLFATILLCIFVFLTLYFWFRYYISNTVIKRIKAKKPFRP